jgi:hypothetical protein
MYINNYIFPFVKNSILVGFYLFMIRYHEFHKDY